jgi:myo-inositol catabolism protein IolC
MENTLQNKHILAILPFDHRSYFEKFFNFPTPLDESAKATIREAKQIIYEACLASADHGVPRESLGILVDDIYGAELLRDAKKQGIVTIQTVEKSGMEYFDFEHENWEQAIELIKPTCLKALVRYDIAKPELCEKSNLGLKKLSDYAHAHDYKLLVEFLVPDIATQVSCITMMQDAGIEPDIWKIEGCDNPSHYQDIIAVAQRSGRDHVGIVILGRNETDDIVASWLKAGENIPGIIGFAVGRTVFSDPLRSYYDHQISRDTCKTRITEKFVHFYNLFTA